MSRSTNTLIPKTPLAIGLPTPLRMQQSPGTSWEGDNKPGRAAEERLPAEALPAIISVLHCRRWDLPYHIVTVAPAGCLNGAARWVSHESRRSVREQRHCACGPND